MRHGAGRLTSRLPRLDELHVGVLERAADRPRLHDEPVGRDKPAATAATSYGVGPRSTTSSQLRRRLARIAGPTAAASAAAPSRGERPVQPEPEARAAVRRQLGGRAAATTRPPTRIVDPVRQPLDVRESWLVSRIATPAAAVRDDRRTAARASGSIPAVGSSRISDLGPADERERECRAAVAPRPRGGGTGWPHGPQTQHVQQLVGIARTGVEAAYWSMVSRGRARRSMPPSWSIRPTRARNERPPRAGSAPSTRTVPASAPPVALDDLDGRGLAGAVGPSNATISPGATRKRHTVDDRPLAVALGPAPRDDGRPGPRGHGAIRAYCVSKSVSRNSPIWSAGRRLRHR